MRKKIAISMSIMLFVLVQAQFFYVYKNLEKKYEKLEKTISENSDRMENMESKMGDFSQEIILEGKINDFYSGNSGVSFAKEELATVQDILNRLISSDYNYQSKNFFERIDRYMSLLKSYKIADFYLTNEQREMLAKKISTINKDSADSNLKFKSINVIKYGLGFNNVEELKYLTSEGALICENADYPDEILDKVKDDEYEVLKYIEIKSFCNFKYDNDKFKSVVGEVLKKSNSDNPFVKRLKDASDYDFNIQVDVNNCSLRDSSQPYCLYFK